MAKEIALSKISKISKAQQNVLLSVLFASIFLGAGISLTTRFIKQIIFNSKVIAAQDESIVTYSDAIKQTGICKKPKGDVYTDDELKNCNPDNIETSEIPGTLRYNILEVLAANQALNSVPQVGTSSCIDSGTGKKYTYEQLRKQYQDATNVTARQAAIQNIKTCSALRVIPDALPSFKNEEAMLASLNQIFLLAGWQPESLSPSNAGYSGNTTTALPDGLNPLEVNLSIEAGTATTMNVLNNIERSIREFDIMQATIEWSGDNSLTLQAKAKAYYMNESTLTESTKTINPGDK